MLNCCKGDLVTQCHNKVRDALGDLAALAYGDAFHEPVVQEGGDGVPTLIADLDIKAILHVSYTSPTHLVLLLMCWLLLRRKRST